MESTTEAGCQCFCVDVRCGRRVLVIDTLSVVWLQDHSVLSEFLEVEGGWELTLGGKRSWLIYAKNCGCSPS